MKIDFISLFKRFIYKNIYIYNLVVDFSKYIYLYLIYDISIDNIILLFNHYL